MDCVVEREGMKFEASHGSSRVLALANRTTKKMMHEAKVSPI